jgi:hypothetical protein
VEGHLGDQTEAEGALLVEAHVEVPEAEGAIEVAEVVTEVVEVLEGAIEAAEVVTEVVEVLEAEVVIEGESQATGTNAHLARLKKAVNQLKRNPLEREMTKPDLKEGPTQPHPLTGGKSKKCQTWSRNFASTTTSCS